ncbi:hypothetical protein [Lentimicrobium sp. S6]|uniref:hypothetical protein n=1 Tax=Lentimicrobium sp. S6 TaxID=2735872 RepID=UPI00155532BB|nr:hypothetical protein [Lentimicrobium sp. S6]NPD47054.1 hypothetical protein [Lentimicrobium sp. S6]
MRNIIKIIFRYLLRHRYLHKTIGFLAFGALGAELFIVKLPEELAPNYIELQEKYDYIPTVVIGYIIEKYASGYNPIAISIYLLIILICLWIDYKLHQVTQTKKSIWNIFIGLSQNINQNYE